MGAMQSNKSILIVAGGVVVVFLMILAYALGRGSAPRDDRTTRKPAPGPRNGDRRIPDTPVVDPHDGDRHAPPARPATPEEKEDAARSLRDIAETIRKMTDEDRIHKLNELQQFLGANLAEGKIAGLQILDMIRAENDPSVLDVLGAVLREYPPALDEPGMVDSILSLARADGSVERRRLGVFILGNAWDKTGSIRQALLEFAAQDPNTDVRMTALGALREFVIRNKDAAGAVSQEIIRIARGAGDEIVRAQAIMALNLDGAPEKLVNDVGQMLRTETSSEVRLSIVEALGNAGPEHRAAGLREIEQAYGREGEMGARAAMLLNIVKLGRHQAVDTLQRVREENPALRQEIQDYIAILQSGEVDMERILERKTRMEMEREPPKDK